MGSEERDELDAAEDDLAVDEGAMRCEVCDGTGVTSSGDCENCGGSGYVPEDPERDAPDL